MPLEVLDAWTIEGICQRYHIPPSAAVREDGDVLWHMWLVDSTRRGGGSIEEDVF